MSIRNQGGRIGTAANTVEIGDKVCVIFGCAFLVVLREKDDGYVVVGDAYVDELGIVEAERDLEEGKYEAEKSLSEDPGSLRDTFGISPKFS
jgi:hypothetical protein